MAKHSSGETAPDKPDHQPRHAKAEPKAIVAGDPNVGYSIKSPGRPEGTAAGDNAGRDR